MCYALRITYLYLPEVSSYLRFPSGRPSGRPSGGVVVAGSFRSGIVYLPKSGGSARSTKGEHYGSTREHHRTTRRSGSVVRSDSVRQRSVVARQRRSRGSFRAYAESWRRAYRSPRTRRAVVRRSHRRGSADSCGRVQPLIVQACGASPFGVARRRRQRGESPMDALVVVGYVFGTWLVVGYFLTRR